MTSENKSWLEKLNDDPKPIYAVILILLFPAIFYNLGLMPLIADEGIRALVAMEMIFNNDYLTPRLGGVFYQNKPPLYNWFIAGGFHISGRYDEFTIRSVMTFFLLLFMVVIYYLTRKEVGNKVAAISALSFFVCGRVLTYDSLYGLIDICFSFFTFVLFMAIYHFGKREQFNLLFLVVYILSSLTFLMKGLPAIVFVGISLIAYLIYVKRWKLLFSWGHILSGLLFLIIVGSYYFLFFKRNPDRTFEDVFVTLLSESSQRTAVKNSILDTLVHLVKFPLDYVLTFLPWTILVVYLFRKEAIRQIRSSEFLKVCVLLFLANILLYWFSPKTHPRYIFMLVPLSSLVFVYLHEHFKSIQRKLALWMERILSIPMVLISVGCISIPFIKDTQVIESIYPIAAVLFLSLSLITWLYFKVAKQRLVLLVLFLIVVRIGFNAIILPIRFSKSEVAVKVIEAKKLGQLSADKDLYVYSEPIRKYLHGEQVLNARTLFYLTSARGKTLQHSNHPQSKDWFIIEDGKPLNVSADTVFMLPSYDRWYPVMEVRGR